MINPDPRFPRRPQHPFFMELSAAVIANDSAADTQPFEDVLKELGIDAESIAYMSGERHALFQSSGQFEPGQDITRAAWLDGFSAGIRLMQNRMAKDGQHRG